MQKNAITICSYGCVAAAVCAFFRWIQNQAGFEAETGLAVEGSFWGAFGTIVCLAAVLGAVFLVRNLWYQGYYPAQTYDEIIHGKQAWLRRITRWIAALMVIGAVVSFAIAGYELYSSSVRTLCVLAIATAWAFVKLSEMPFEDEENKSPHKQTFLAAIPVAMYIYWLIVSYRTHAAVPSMWSYALEIFAISASLLGMFYFAGYGFEFPRPYAAMGCLLSGAILSLASLMDSRNVGLSLMLVAGAAMQLYYLWMIVSTLSEQWPEEAEEK